MLNRLVSQCDSINSETFSRSTSTKTSSTDIPDNVSADELDKYDALPVVREDLDSSNESEKDDSCLQVKRESSNCESEICEYLSTDKEDTYLSTKTEMCESVTSTTKDDNSSDESEKGDDGSSAEKSEKDGSINTFQNDIAQTINTAAIHKLAANVQNCENLSKPRRLKTCTLDVIEKI